jgi:hypothetical protein
MSLDFKPCGQEPWTVPARGRSQGLGSSKAAGTGLRQITFGYGTAHEHDIWIRGKSGGEISLCSRWPMTGFVIALSVIVWLYTIVAIHNGGGFTTTLALLGTFGMACFGMFWAMWAGDAIVLLALSSAVIVGFLVQIRASDDGLLN